MENRVVRGLAWIELAVIVLPTLLFAIAGLAGVDVAAPETSFPFARRLFRYLVMATPILCICCGLLIAALALGGRSTLLRAPLYLWVGTVVGVVVTLAGVMAYLDNRLNWLVIRHPAVPKFGIFALGAPMLLPAFHVFWERIRRMPADDALERTREG